MSNYLALANSSRIAAATRRTHRRLIGAEESPKALAASLALKRHPIIGYVAGAVGGGLIAGGVDCFYQTIAGHPNEPTIGGAGDYFDDPETIAMVQRALAALPTTKLGDTALPDYLVKQAHADAVLAAFAKEKVDGKLGPKTAAALARFNSSYRGEPGDGSRITEGVLEALKLSPVAAPHADAPRASAPPRPSGPAASQGTAITTNATEGEGMAPWKIATITGVGAAGLVALLVGLLASH